MKMLAAQCKVRELGHTLGAVSDTGELPMCTPTPYTPNLLPATSSEDHTCHTNLRPQTMLQAVHLAAMLLCSRDSLSTQC